MLLDLDPPRVAPLDLPRNGAGLAPGSSEEAARFDALQTAFLDQFEHVFPDPKAPRTVVVVPSLTLPQDELRKIDGATHYEERMLFALMLLRMPRTRVVYVTSQPLPPGIVDYVLNLLAGVPSVHARERLTLLACHDHSDRPLTQKLLDRPRLLDRIRRQIADPTAAHLTVFNATELERTLAVRLGIPLYACDPALRHLGTKSGSREIFREAGVPLPDGFEHLHTPAEIAHALAVLKQRNPALRKAVVKLDEGFSGEGNAIFSYAGAPASLCSGDTLERWIADVLPERLQFEAKTETWDHYAASFAAMGGIVEAFVDGARKTSPSVQCRVDPTGRASVISTHEQVLGGPSGQVFLGCTFPAAAPYRLALQDAGERIGAVLAERGALGRFGVDFLCVEDPATENGWRYVAIEINLRKGGTTHPYLMLDFLTDGAYDPETGLYCTPSGQPRYYYASDNLTSERYRGLTPYDLVDLAVYHGLHFHGATQEGVVFHLIGALSEFGKLGVLCIGATPERAQALYDETVALLDRETAATMV